MKKILKTLVVSLGGGFLLLGIWGLLIDMSGLDVTRIERHPLVAPVNVWAEVLAAEGDMDLPTYWRWLVQTPASHAESIALLSGPFLLALSVFFHLALQVLGKIRIEKSKASKPEHFE